MGLRFQRRIKVFPGCHLNVSGSAVGVSFGGRGAHVGYTSRGQKYVSLGIPGTGISWREVQRKPVARAASLTRCDHCAPGHLHVPVGLLVFVTCTGLILWAVFKV